MDWKKILKEVGSWVGMFLITFILFGVVESEVMAKVTVNMSSMEKTLFEGQQLLVNKLSYKFDDPERGDIIIFLHEEEKGSVIDGFVRFMDNIMAKIQDRKPNSEAYVKRVIGVEGDVIDIKDGSVYINGEKQIEAYVNGDTYPSTVEYPVTVGEDELFVLGDNRPASSDSRAFGVINFNQIEGKVVYRVYPFNVWGGVE